MRIIVSKNHLFAKLRTVGKIVKPSKELAYGSFLFEITDTQTLFVTGCDESGQISTIIECDIQDPENICFLLDAQMILNSLKELSEQPIEIEIKQAEKAVSVVIHYHNGKFEMAGSDPALFPKMPDRSASQSFVINSKVLKKGLALGKFASNDELRPILSTVNLSCSAGVLSFAATSGSVLGIYEESEHQVAEEINVNIPGKISKIVSDLLQAEADIEIEYDSRSILFKIDTYNVQYRLFEGKYPNFRSVIPSSSKIQVRVNCEDLIAAINRVSIFADDHSSLVKFELSNNNMILTSQSIEYGRSAKEDIFLDTVYEDFEIGFKSNLLSDVLKSIESKECFINLTSSSKAALFVPADRSDSQFILMPMQVNN